MPEIVKLIHAAHDLLPMLDLRDALDLLAKRGVISFWEYIQAIRIVNGDKI